MLVDVSFQGHQLTRLEPRTKESTHMCKCMRHIRECVVKGVVLIVFFRGNSRPQFAKRGLSASISVGTRKMVNYI